VSQVEFRKAQAVSFGRAAAAYERGRPLYPAEALDWLLPADARRVLDLGAGTGQLSRQLAARGYEVTAVEPSEEMRLQFRQVLPEVRALAGSAEHIPLDDAAVDVVLVAQAWHWVDVDRAVPEVARVLAVPGGRLGLMWNIRDEREDWVRQLGRIMHRGPEQDMTSTDPRIGPPFSAIERFDIMWTHYLSTDHLLDMVASRSYVITLPDHERADVMKQVRDLVNGHRDLAGRDTLALPYLTRCARAHVS
jgi:SAM-dependent methyltransferase